MQMLLNKDVELIDGEAAAYIGSMRALVVSDLHLGYEGVMAKSGLFIPKANLSSIISALERSMKGRNVERVIIVGDIKNDFSEVGAEELNEINDLFAFLRQRRVNIILVRGNHDNFIDSYASHFRIVPHPEHVRIGDYLFAHGDKALAGPAMRDGVKMLMLGHEHPSISIRTKVGTTEKLRCFLHGNYRGVEMLVLPAIGYFETGSDIIRGRKFMSPILDMADAGSLHAIAVGYG